MEDIVEDGEGFKDVPPVLALVVEALLEHLYDFDKVLLVVGQLGELCHLGPARPPRVVAGRVADLCLRVRVALDRVFRDAHDALAHVGHGRRHLGRRCISSQTFKASRVKARVKCCVTQRAAAANDDLERFARVGSSSR